MTNCSSCNYWTSNHESGLCDACELKRLAAENARSREAILPFAWLATGPGVRSIPIRAFCTCGWARYDLAFPPAGWELRDSQD